MDVFAIKNQGATEAYSPATGAPALPATSNAFADLLQKAGARFEGDMAALIGRTTQTDAPEQAHPAAREDDRDYPRRDKPLDDRRADDGRAGERTEHRPDPARPEHGDGDGDGRDAAPAERERRESSGAGHRDEDAGSEPAARDANPAGAAEGVDDATTDRGTGAAQGNTATPGDRQGASGEADAASEAQASEVIAAAQPLVDGRQHAEAVLSGLLQMAQAAATPQTKVEDPARPTRQGPSENAIRGLNAAVDAVTAPKSPAGGLGLDAQARHDGAQTKGAASQSAAHAETHGRAPVDPSAHANSGAAQQAAGLARLVGPASRLAVEVTVADDAATLVSRPLASLAAASVAASDGGNQSRSGTQSNANHGQGATTPFAAQAGQAAGPDGPRPQQAAFTPTQEQNLASTAAQAKGAPGTGSSAAGAHPQALGGDATPSHGSGSVSEGQQVRQAAPQQAANAPRPLPAAQALVDQVSVQITKALQSGVDRISIQLRPESMGRVEVRLEMAHDGRVTALVIADNKDTLDTLQRDARNLQQALLDAGLHTGANDLSFNLRGENAGAHDDGGAGAGGGGEPTAAADAEGEDLLALLGSFDADVVSDTRVNIRV